MPDEIAVKHGVRREAIYETHVVNFVCEALVDANYTPFATRFGEYARKMQEEIALKLERQAAAAKAAATKPAPAPARRPPPAAVAATDDTADTRTGAVGGGGSGNKRPAAALSSDGPDAKQARTALAKPAGEVRTAAASKAASGKAANASSGREPDDAYVARAMLAVLRKAKAPLSLSQVALESKSANPTVLWNFARWLQAVQRGMRARPTWFTAIGSEMLGVGPEAGVEPKAANAASEAEEGAQPAAASDTGDADPAEAEEEALFGEFLSGL